MIPPGNPIIDTISYLLPPEEENKKRAMGDTPDPNPRNEDSEDTSTSNLQHQLPPQNNVISSDIPNEFNLGSYKDVDEYMQRKQAQYQPLSDKDLKKLRNRQRAISYISAISDAAMSVANLIAAHNYAPSMVNPSSSMSARARERFDKDKAARDAADNEYFNWMLAKHKLDRDNKEYGLNLWLQQQNLARNDRAYNDSRSDRSEDVGFRNKEFDTRNNQWRQSFDYQKESDEKNFKEGQRRFNVSSSHENRRLALDERALEEKLKGQNYPFDLGDLGIVNVPTHKLRESTIATLYNSIPKKYRDEYSAEHGITSPEDYLSVVGAYAAYSPGTQKILQRLAAGDRQGTMPGVKKNQGKMPGVK